LNTTPRHQRLGPIWLAPGITPANALTKFYTAFVAIAMLSGASILQGYILTEHLNIPRGQQGTVSGEISFWVEIVAIFLLNPFGVPSDRIGRRPVFVLGITIIGIGFSLIPFATTYEELLAYRLIFAVGMAATSGSAAMLTNDYPREDSRGKMIGFTSVMNTLGTIFVAGVIARIPAWMADDGFDAITGGRVMYGTAAALCIVTAIIARFGLAGGTVVAKHERPPISELLRSGVRAAKNPRIAVAYAGAFAARSDVVIKGLFFALWAIQDGVKQDMNPGEAMARFGIMLVLMNTCSIIAAPVFGWFIDRVNRMTALVIALCFASFGYLSMRWITSPLDFSMWPFFVIIALGSGFMMKSSLSLLGQEAPIGERGSVISTGSMCGAIGILIFTKWGGQLYDSWGPWAPFFLAGLYQATLLFVAIAVRIIAPGRPAPNPFRRRGKTAAMGSPAAEAPSAER